MSPRWRRALRVAGSIAILAIVIVFLPSGSLAGALEQASPIVLSASLLVYLSCHLAAAFKWRMLMGRGVELPFVKVLQAHFTGLIANLSPLGMIGGDIVRAGIAINGSARPASIMVSGVVDRVIDTAALVILTVVGFAWIGGRSATAEVVLWGGLALVTVGAGASAAALTFLKRSGNKRLAGFRDAAQVLVDQPGLVARALVLSVLIQGVLVTTNAYIGSTVGVDSSLAAWFLAWPAAKLAAYIPVGIAGIGIRESALIALFRPLGGAPGPVMASGLLLPKTLAMRERLARGVTVR